MLESFKSKNNVTRVQFASFLSRTIKLIERDHHVIHFEKTAKELGFNEISKVTTIENSNLHISYTHSKLHIYGRYDGDFLINEEVIIEGTNFFGHPHESRMHLNNQLMSHNEFNVIEKYIPGGHGSVHMSLFLMHSFTGEHFKRLDTGLEYVDRTSYKDDPSLSMYFQTKDTGIIEHTITGNVMTVQNGEVMRTRKTVPYRYYYDYQGVMVTDTVAKNYIGDNRYEVTIGGDVYFEGKRITDRRFYFLPITRPVPFPGYNDSFAGFAYTDDITLQQILAFHQTDGQISSIPKQFMYPNVLVIDGERNIYGTIDLRDATFGKFEEIRD
ncbi:hypothetical protein [Robertmurraya andreesenii]|uniref:Uncharacterized protein n=1 Tax=Anoxybacillus andreesenii TaxID=1325932 RepID=A0ABT9V9R0_9BACL|nr:hypothetical protein [Robertmurraya andreesenii]MDQ0157677.1 hypothetical protein [Robertmurraya andreesenii]